MALPQAQTATELTPESWARLQAIFLAALDSAPERRALLLDELCGADEPLRSEVEALLRAEQVAHGFLDAVISDLKETLSTASCSDAEAGFEGNDRFELRRRIGSGGFGAVYEAYDRDQNTVVALKALHRAGPMEILRFKREFRSLVDITHPNLAPPYELLCDGERWFFTMELVDGVSFLKYVRGSSGECDERKLRGALAQLAAGVNALHESGRLHCDLKPSNVLVTPQGSVRIVDFGLVSTIAGNDGRSFAGTPAYMAPERRESGASSVASDWYSVGVMLHEALAGRLPTGDVDQGFLPPGDLSELCRQLLSRNAAERPTGHNILRLLDAGNYGDSLLSGESIFVGRQPELASLQNALQSVASANVVTACVIGSSGTGKTALVQRFLELAQRDPGVLALTGRCYEQESVPFNALDDMVDLLARYFGRLSVSAVHELLDSETALAARLFPVLEPFAPPARREKIESQELQQAAFGAFRKLLKRISERRRLIIHLDDVQWANPDSLRLLTELLRQPGAPSMLLVLAFRPDSNQALDAFEAQASTKLQLHPLAPAEAGQLASLLLPEIPRREEWVARIASESGGNPFLLGEFAQYAYSADMGQVDAAVSLERMLQERFSKLPEAARELLEVVAVAGHPVEAPIAWKAAHYEGAQQSALALLRARRLVRLRRIEKRHEIEIYHDRIRATVENGLAPETRKRRHLDLAIELENSSAATPESLAIHFFEGGEGEKAFQHSVIAAEAAARSLAFESAARWCRLALSVRENHEVRVRLADALSSSGRGKEAADLYLACLHNAAPSEQLDLHRRAATDLLISGHTQQGIEVLEDVLRRIGLKAPPSGWRAIPSLLLHRTWIAIHGLKAPAAPRLRYEARQLERVDVCWSVTRGFGMVDTIRAAEFHARHLLLTLRLGEPYRIARELCVEAGYHALSGERRKRHVEWLLATASQLAETCGNPHAIAMVAFLTGMAAFLAGRWAKACKQLEEAETLLRETCSGVAWELATARLMGAASSYFFGEIKKLSERLPLLLQNARARGDLYESTMEIRIAHVVRLARDEVQAARAGLAAATAPLPRGKFFMPHWWALIAGVEIALYGGDAAGAWGLLESHWRPLERSLLMRAQYIHIESLFHRARAALAVAAATPGQRKRFLRIALADAARIERQKAHWGVPVSALIRACAGAIDGPSEPALSHFESAETAFRSADMHLFAAAARRRRGLLIGGDEGRGLVQEADAWMQGQEIVNTACMTSMLAPSRG